VIGHFRQVTKCLVGLFALAVLHGSGDPIAVTAACHLAKPQVAAFAHAVPVRLATQLQLARRNGVDLRSHSGFEVRKKYGNPSRTLVNFPGQTQVLYTGELKFQDVPRSPKSLPSHGGGRRFKPCTAHQVNHRLTASSGAVFVARNTIAFAAALLLAHGVFSCSLPAVRLGQIITA
jgi:hypothetical protein